MIPPTESLDEAVNAAGGSPLRQHRGLPLTVTRSEDRGRAPPPVMLDRGDSESVISTTVTVEDGASLSFRWDVSAEKNYDVARFQVDGAQLPGCLPKPPVHITAGLPRLMNSRQLVLTPCPGALLRT